MNGYSKLRLVNKSRSIDFSDLSTSSKTFPHQIQKIPENSTSNSSETDNQDPDTINHDDHDQYPTKQLHQQDEDEDQAACSKNSTSVGAKYLSKNYSVSSAISPHRYKLERQRSTATKRGIQSAVKRVFSMRRSSSSTVSHEKYCRIHDQCIAVLLDDDDVDEDIYEATEDNIASVEAVVRSMEKKKCGSKGRILKACKRILGF